MIAPASASGRACSATTQAVKPAKGTNVIHRTDLLLTGDSAVTHLSITKPEKHFKTQPGTSIMNGGPGDLIRCGGAGHCQGALSAQAQLRVRSTFRRAVCRKAKLRIEVQVTFLWSCPGPLPCTAAPQRTLVVTGPVQFC